MGADIDQLGRFLAGAGSLAVVTGAGVSTGSGIPDYRDDDGRFKHAEPIQFARFASCEDARRRYWARSYLGWRRFSAAKPNPAHEALAELELAGNIDTLITQNVDRLHSAAGSRAVIDLHGDLGKVRCLGCGTRGARADYQQALRAANPGWHAEVFRYLSDGDAVLAESGYNDFIVPPCIHCKGVVKPDVVMFGESVPRERVARAMEAIDRADALLVVGSSLMLYSGFRFARRAHEQGKPIAIVNRGRTRADDLATLKVERDCATVLPAAVRGSTG